MVKNDNKKELKKKKEQGIQLLIYITQRKTKIEIVSKKKKQFHQKH